MATTTYITKLWDRLSRIAWDYYGTLENRQVEKILEANPGLEKQGILLDPGLTITIPDIPVTSSQPRILPQINLWG
jgi:phage tail protein X